MGIKGLQTFLLKHFNGKGISRNHISKYYGLCVAVDLSLLLFRFNIRKTATLESYKLELSNFIDKWTSNGVTLIFIFDGKPNIEKAESIAIRKSYKDVQQSKLDDLSNQLQSCDTNDSDSNSDSDIRIELQMQIDKKRKKAYKIDTQQLDSCKALFDSLCICYIHIESMETDAIIPYLFANNIVQACYSSDTDLHPYGCKIILHDIDFIENTVQEDNHCEILKHLNMIHNDFVIICSIAINDYNKTLKYCKLEELFDLFCKYKTIENIADNLSSINIGRTRQIELPSRQKFESVYDIYTKDLTSQIKTEIDNTILRFNTKKKHSTNNYIIKQKNITTLLDDIKKTTSSQSLFNYYSSKILRICNHTYSMDITFKNLTYVSNMSL